MAGIKDQTLSPKGYTKTTSAGSVITPTVPAGATRVLIKVEVKAVRWRDDGVNPDGTTGTPVDVGDEFWYTGQLRALRFIEDGATSTSILHLTYYA